VGALTHIELTMANWPNRWAATAAAIVLIALVLGATPAYLGLASNSEQPSKAISNHSQSASLQLALNKLSPKRLAAPKRLWRVVLQAESSVASSSLVLLGPYVAFVKAGTPSAGEEFHVPIRAPPRASI
jgi:hypothetical protein